MSTISPEADPKSRTMRAWTHVQRGKPSDVLTLKHDLPIPTLTKPTQILIKISHAALNPGGSIIMQLLPPVFRTKPCIPELDFSGHVVQVGSEVSPESPSFCSPGAAVFGGILVGPHVRGSGALVDYVVADADANNPSVLCLPIRDETSLSLEHAAGLCVTGSTALDLLESAKLERGMRVLVNGASGGIGSLVVQMVRKAVGDAGYVVAVSSAGNEKLVRDLGADEVIDRRLHAPVEDFLTQNYRLFDVVIDAYGSQTLFDKSPGFLKTDGTFVTVGIAAESLTSMAMLQVIYRMLTNILWPRVIGGTPRKYTQVASTVSIGKMVELRRLCETGELKVVVDSCWDMEDVEKAYDRMLGKGAKGKVIVRMEKQPTDLLAN